MYLKSIFRILSIFALLLLFMLVFAACSVIKLGGETEPDESIDETLIVSTTHNQTTDASTQAADDFSADTIIILDDENTIINGDGASFENSILNISKSGTYSIKGKLSDGKIYINSADEEKKVKLVLDGVDISCSTDAPLFVENSPRETLIILSEGSVNSFSDTVRAVPEDESADYATAAIYSKDDLQIEGSGRLNVKGNFNKGIFSKNDIDIRGGVINIESADDGIRGKESIDISDGAVSITSGGDGLRTNETANQEKGDISVSGGVIKIISEGDGIQATSNVIITGGSFNIKSGGGATGEFSKGESVPGMPGKGQMGKGDKGGGHESMHFGVGRPQIPDSSALEEAKVDTVSTKGIKAGKSMNISGGEIIVDSKDDSLHAVNIALGEGTYRLRSDDDGIHADENIKIDSSDINIENSYEGIEGRVIEIGSGNIIMRSEDDGINAAGDDSSGDMPMHQADESCKIIMNDGYVHIDACGDGIDSNGSVKMQGGTMIVFGPEDGGNAALDYAGSFTISGGTLLAVGSAGMAQSVKGSENAEVLAFNFSQSADTLTAITDGDGKMDIAFVSTKKFDAVVYASENINSNKTYRIYQGGTIEGESKNGVCLDGKYTPGELVGSLS